jgi:transposase InsO family protein
MVERADTRITHASGMTTWRAGCGESRTSGSEGGPTEPTSRKAGRALRSDPYTFVRTWAGFVYVALIVDVYAQRIVAWHAATSKATELVMTPLRMALWQRGRDGHPAVPGELIHHSDAGTQPTGDEVVGRRTTWSRSRP